MKYLEGNVSKAFILISLFIFGFRNVRHIGFYVQIKPTLSITKNKQLNLNWLIASLFYVKPFPAVLFQVHVNFDKEFFPRRAQKIWYAVTSFS